VTRAPPADEAVLAEPAFSGLRAFPADDGLSCGECCAGLCCHFEGTVYRATRALDREWMDGTAQIHGCFRAFTRACCGCGSLYD
jgi:hypothetical protein